MRNGKDNHVATIVGPDVSFEGTLVSKTGIRIEGSLKGGIKCEGVLIVGSTAKVEAGVVCGDIYVAGEVKGNITGKNMVEVSKSGRIIGDITTSNLIMEPGAVFDGKCNMNHHSEEQEPACQDLIPILSNQSQDQRTSDMND